MLDDTYLCGIVPIWKLLLVIWDLWDYKIDTNQVSWSEGFYKREISILVLPWNTIRKVLPYVARLLFR